MSPEGASYEKDVIIEYLKLKKKDPISRKYLSS